MLDIPSESILNPKNLGNLLAFSVSIFHELDQSAKKIDADLGAWPGQLCSYVKSVGRPKALLAAAVAFPAASAVVFVAFATAESGTHPVAEFQRCDSHWNAMKTFSTVRMRPAKRGEKSTRKQHAIAACPFF